MSLQKISLTLVFFTLFFFQPAFNSVQVCGTNAAVADSSAPVAACPSALYSEVDFRWAFAAKSARNGKPVTRPVTQNMALKSGDKLKMMVELQKRCFVYLFHDDGVSGVKLLFPYTLQQFTRYYQPGHRYYIPRANGWFRLDNTPGREVFYLIASAKRLDGLEKAYFQYSSAGGEAKIEQGKALLARLEDLSRKQRDLCSPAERPVTIGGALRSVKDLHDSKRLDIAAYSSEIVTKDFTARTYTIEHQ